MDFDTLSIDFGWISMGFHFIFIGLWMVCNAFSIGFCLFYNGPAFVFYWVPLAFLWPPFIILWVLACFLMDPLHSSAEFPLALLMDPLIILLYSPLFSNVFLIVFKWVPFNRLLGSPLLSVSILCVSDGPLHFSIVFPVGFYCVPPCSSMAPLRFSIGTPSFFYWDPLVFYRFLLHFQ